MHIYIFDSFLKQNKYSKIIAKIETRLTDLGLNGKNCYVGPLKSLRSIVNEELRREPKTMIAVGNDNTFNQLINTIVYENITIGFIPVGTNSIIADCLGIEDEDQACNVLSARLIERVSLGRINDFYFILKAIIPTKGTVMEFNGQYTIEIPKPGYVEIVNLEQDKQVKKEILKTYITTSEGKIVKKDLKDSYIPARRILVNNLKNNFFTIDNAQQVDTPAELSKEEDMLSVIAGKGRKF